MFEPANKIKCKEIIMEDETKNEKLSGEKAETEKTDIRKGDDRRCRKSLGHLYITTIGWICRRERDRRNKECRE